MRIALPGRTLLLVAGMPGAGKSTLLSSLPAEDGVVVLDSDAQRAAVRALAPGVPYAWLRPLVHLLHRAAVVLAACSAARTVVVHLPATRPSTRAAVARLAAATGRTAHLLWLQVEAEAARSGQYARGRVVPAASFDEHARRAATAAGELLGRPQPGWRTVTVLDRAAARGGLRLHTAAVPAATPEARPAPRRSVPRRSPGRRSIRRRAVQRTGPG